jgi:iron complex transport system substrate-binding protein
LPAHERVSASRNKNLSLLASAAAKTKMSSTPQRVVCLSAESADWLWRLGAWEHVMGVTAYFTQPSDVPHKPRVSGFSSAQVEEIVELKPDLVIAFSDVQARLASELIRMGLNVLATNQRTISETQATLAMLARVMVREHEGEMLLRDFREKLTPVNRSRPFPRVYFEEWNDPLISGIAWVSELIERACGQDVFPELREKRTASERVVSNEQILRANPQLIIASWCGKPVDTNAIASRPGWSELDAVRNGRVFKLPGADVLQPGYRLVYGFEKMKRFIANVE